MKLSRKISLSFVIVILFSIFIVSGISNFMINNKFETYLIKEQNIKLKQISDEINNLYEENEYKLYQREINSYASLDNLSIDVLDLNNNVIYSSSYKGKARMHKRMMEKHGVLEGNYVEKSFPLLKQNEQVGRLVIGYKDNSHLTEGAIIFKHTLTKSLFLSAILAILIGIGTSIILSKSLTAPLLSIRNAAIEIQKGNLNTKSTVNTNTKEIKELSDSINYLGHTLAKQENIRKKYASDISHELRTPLTTLQSHIEAIIDGVWEASDQHLKILMDEINRLSSLVDNLKYSFNLQEHNLILNKTSFDISKELKNIIRTFQPLLNNKNIVIESNIEDYIQIYMDRDKFKQIVYNLLSNSIKYISTQGKISVALEKKKDNILLNISDNGIGIKEEDLKYIFERFYRVDESRNKNTGGTGLGLSIVKSIVDIHNGNINVKSKYGEGTEFTITLPIKN